MIKKLSFFSVLIIMALWTVSVQAQFENFQSFYFTQHRPPNQNWQQLKTPHFRIIYPAKYDSLAYRTAKILESQYPITSKLAGGDLINFPFIITDYNDLSNGFVTSSNFRSEIDLAPSKGKTLNPASGDWLETVVPHELLHANHGNVRVTGSIPYFYGLFSPDFRRAFNFFPPVGVHEGLAVHHETENVLDGGGRADYTYFNNQYNAKLSSVDPWSAGQTFQTSTYTNPLNRHYISGTTFTRWLHKKYGDDVSKKAIRYHHKFFFVGYGFALKHVTGKWPDELFNEYLTDKTAEENKRKLLIGETTSDKHKLIDTPYKGVLQRKPIWISEENLTFFGIHYNAPRGFYKYNLKSGKTERAAEVFTVSDYNIDYDRDENSILFSEYDADFLYPSTFKAELKRLDLDTGESFEITKKDRVYSPTISGSKIIALQTVGSNANVISIDELGVKTVLASFKDAYPVSVLANPSSPEQLAVIVNRRGVQALWITTPQKIAQDILEAPRVAFKSGSIVDLNWHPTEQKLLFTADMYPAMNIYELNLSNGDILQKTNSLYNVFEASYSPDASSIAYVTQQPDQQQRIAILKKENFYNKRVERDHLLSGNDLQQKLTRPLIGSELDGKTNSWETKKYSSDLSWLKPRILLPVLRENSGAEQFGINIQSVDALSSQSYNAEITGIQDRIWYDFSYTNKTFLPGFNFRAYSEPQFGVLDLGNNQGLAVMQQERGFRLSIPMNFTFNGTTRGKSLYFEPRFTAEQFRYFDLSPEPISDFETQYKLGAFSQLSWNILTQRRDIQPSSGLSLFGFVDKALNDPQVNIDGVQNNLILEDRWAAYYGLIGYVAPFRKWNQSLRFDIHVLNQSKSLLYNTSTIIPESFTDNAFLANPQQGIAAFNNLGRISTRYTIPVSYVDDGGMLIPAYLSSIYLSLFSHTITNLEKENLDALREASRSVFGAGIHFQFNFSNINFDFGLGVSFEPSRNNTKFVYGTF